MQIIRAEGALQRDLTPAGPTVEALIDQTPDGGRLAVTEIVIPPGVGMREHDHGGSEALLVPLDGVLAVTSGTQRRDISSGIVAPGEGRAGPVVQPEQRAVHDDRGVHIRPRTTHR